MPFWRSEPRHSKIDRAYSFNFNIQSYQKLLNVPLILSLDLCNNVSMIHALTFISDILVICFYNTVIYKISEVSALFSLGCGGVALE
jgi:hypothetical protein